MKPMRGVRPRRVNEPLQGQILQELLIATSTPSDLARRTRKDIWAIRCEIIALHHIGVIEPIGMRTDTPRLGKTLYDKDYVWSITDHGMTHHSTVVGCFACKLRERVLLVLGGFPR